MRNGILAAAVICTLAGMSGGVAAQTPPANLGVSVEVREEVRNSFIFVLRDDVPANEVGRHANALAAGAGGRVTHVYTAAIKGFAAKLPDEAAARMLAANPRIASYEPDAIAYAFAKPGTSVSYPCTAPQTPKGITRVGGGEPAPANHKAWVIDTGIDFEHPDLNVDTVLSKSFLLRRSSADDGNGHGTHVAGTIGAWDNGCDVVGVAAGARLVAVRVLDNNGSGTYSGVIAGVDYVAANAQAGDVANMSLGGGFSATLNAAVENAAGKGIFFALAAGNESDEAAKYSPASAKGSNIYTVSAVDSGDNFAWFSNHGDPIKCAAPGVDVVSTRKGGGVTTMSGTSMAAPHVAGLLLWGTPNFSGSANNDPDGSPDPICHR
ncbi:S8 family serine peptidase [Aromatoleum toluvorans]|uniref:S8 family serine peptidase n=1 Tax=Aromatoleum toluvorans TaxID=92002 RepID=A0ABX1Q3W1_9RHOO|nr:S8 family serine peptidase [Aromatoleum toluvorans]NMG45446.1 S8 family serine peptidase [Aromatoleum toluvorans]